MITAILKHRLRHKGQHMTTARERRQRREQDVTGQIEGRYAAQAAQLLQEYDVRICHWRANMTGIAWIGLPDRIINWRCVRTSVHYRWPSEHIGPVWYDVSVVNGWIQAKSVVTLNCECRQCAC